MQNWKKAPFARNWRAAAADSRAHVAAAPGCDDAMAHDEERHLSKRALRLQRKAQRIVEVATAAWNPKAAREHPAALGVSPAPFP
jgi:hypothetical protein